MDNDLINSKGDGPIIRRTASDRVATFQANSNSIYNKYSPFTTYSTGPSQPFVYTKISDSTFSKNLTKYDTQAFPVGSTVRDLKRIGQYSVTGNGILYLGKQLLLQNNNAFNETRIYNPLSLLKATARPGSLGAIDAPQRHIEIGGGLLDFFKTAVFSTLGIRSEEMANRNNNPIDGTAYGSVSTYVASLGGSRAGKLRLGTAAAADGRFSKTWISSTTGPKPNGGFLQNLLNGLIKNLKNSIPSTNPRGRVNGDPDLSWEHRPEYPAGKDGVYYAFLQDTAGILKFFNTKKTFYNDSSTEGKTVEIVATAHKYYPDSNQPESSYYEGTQYATSIKIAEESVTQKSAIGNGSGNNLQELYNKMVAAIAPSTQTANQFKPSTERQSEVTDYKGVSYPTYKDIPGKGSEGEKFGSLMQKLAITLDDRMFAKVSDYKQNSLENASDQYNSYDVIGGERNTIPTELLAKSDEKQSQDLIFFYFYDLINKVYVPFRATITSLSDQHSAEWEDVNYIGRADKLFLYKGFSRDVNFSFSVYANSAKEMLPMWNRINYLVGFTKPSKYTDMGVRTNIKDKDKEANLKKIIDGLNEASDNAMEDDQDTQANINAAIAATESERRKTVVSGKESRFIYPPMVTLRLGDVFYDQPCVVSSVGINIPDDTNWETLRSEDYSYVASPTKTININGVKSRQLPMKVDVSVQLKLMEKRQALGSNAHYGNASYGTGGTETGRWLL